MKHNLDAINAAITLGDKVIPPIGCEVRVYDATYMNEYTGIIVDIKYIEKLKYHCIKILSYNAYIYKYLSGSKFHLRLLEVLLIPDNIIPFEGWERY